MMLRTATRLPPYFAIAIFRKNINENDQDYINNPLPQTPATGWERVKAMYSTNQHEELSMELANVFQSAMTGAFIGGCLGGFINSRQAYLYFIENNQASIFKTTADAKKKLQDYVTVAFAKGAYKWGWRLCFFTGIFSLTANTISVYRGDTSLVEYVTAGALAGAVYKLDMGLIPMLVGASLGAALSTIAGLAILGILKVTGVTMKELKYSLYKIKLSREDQMKQVYDKTCEVRSDKLTKHHEAIVSIKGEKKIEELPDI